MHYRNGRVANNGDKIIQIGSNGQIQAFGVLHSAVPGNDFCNGQIATIQPQNQGACICDCLHVDDLASILASAGLDQRKS